MPPVQVCSPTQAFPQSPQWAGLLKVSTQAVPQSLPIGQVQTPLEQVCVPTQAWPHPPQLLKLTSVLTQVPSQSSCGGMQTQVLLVH